VRTNIYNNSPKLGRGFIKKMIDNCYSPPEDGAQVRPDLVWPACLAVTVAVVDVEGDL